MALCRPRPRTHKYRRSNSCWRNPCVVFFVTFTALFSLRFRTPKNRKAAAGLLKDPRGKLLNKRHKQENSLGELSTIVTSNKLVVEQSDMFEYRLFDQGSTSNGASFVKYQAIHRSEGQPVFYQQWAQAISTPVGANDISHPSDSFTKLFKDSSYQGFFFETPPVTKLSAATRPFEFVLVDAPDLVTFAGGAPDTRAFANQFVKSSEGALTCVFPSLGKDALLIAPLPLTQEGLSMKSYTHLAAFVRNAPIHQVRDLWSTMTSNLLERLDDKLLWLSTSGMGIKWLHLRLDSRPKYYTFKEYTATSNKV